MRDCVVARAVRKKEKSRELSIMDGQMDTCMHACLFIRYVPREIYSDTINTSCFAFASILCICFREGELLPVLIVDLGDSYKSNCTVNGLRIVYYISRT